MGTPNFTKEDAKKAMCEVCGMLLEEITKEDRIPQFIISSSRKSVESKVERYLDEFDAQVDWDGLAEKMTLDELRTTMTRVLRPELRKMCAPLRPS